MKPNQSSLIFVAYMTFSISQGLLITASRKGGEIYPYNPTLIVLLTENLKLIISWFHWMKDNTGITSGLRQFAQHSRILTFYMIPASLYCLSNNLSFESLRYFDPTTYIMLMQLRILLTGLVFKIVFKKSLSPMQWISLILITLGCMIQNADIHHPADTEPEISNLLAGLAFTFVQIFCSVLAGVYNEYIIKHIVADEVDLRIQNMFMYIDSILANLFFLFVKGELVNILNQSLIAESHLQLWTLAIIMNNALFGITTSIFLKSLNSILKAFANAVDVILTAILSQILFGIPIHWNTIIAAKLIGLAIFLYSNYPIQNGDLTTKHSGNVDLI